jgi:hypothetical protein
MSVGLIKFGFGIVAAVAAAQIVTNLPSPQKPAASNSVEAVIPTANPQQPPKPPADQEPIKPTPPKPNLLLIKLGEKNADFVTAAVNVGRSFGETTEQTIARIVGFSDLYFELIIGGRSRIYRELAASSWRGHLRGIERSAKERYGL